MRFIIKGFVANKTSEFYSDCADNYAFNTKNGRFAISDGVSVSFFPEIWSKILVKNYVNTKSAANSNFVHKCQKEWLEKVEGIVNQPTAKWFVKTKYAKKEFAAATFLGLEFLASERKWTVQFIGDSFLFFVPKHCVHFEGVIRYPDKAGFVFDNYPDYLASTENNHRGEQYVSVEEEITEGTFFLMTDALSEWFIKELRKDVSGVVGSLLAVENQKQFLELIKSQRDIESLKNDDSSVLIIEVVDDGNEAFDYSVAYVSNLGKLAKRAKKRKQSISVNRTQEEGNNLNVFDKF